MNYKRHMMSVWQRRAFCKDDPIYRRHLTSFITCQAEASVFYHARILRKEVIP